jgi:hypothetical protein
MVMDMFVEVAMGYDTRGEAAALALYHELRYTRPLMERLADAVERLTTALTEHADRLDAQHRTTYYRGGTTHRT